MRYRNLDYPESAAVGELGPAALDDILERGGLEQWSSLGAAVLAEPAGSLADTVLRLCEAHEMYGTSAVWIAWIARLRGGGSQSELLSLAELRRARGLTQEQIAQRLSISQSDVSKLERRGNLRLETLRAYVGAMGGRIELTARFNDASRQGLVLETREHGASSRRGPRRGRPKPRREASRREDR